MGKFTQRWKQIKPDKPKRPANNFALFVRHYKLTAPEPPLGPQLFEEAAMAWGSMCAEDKADFKDQIAIDQYKKSLAEYRQEISARKQPAQSYGLFVRHYWKTKRPQYNGGRREFGNIQRRIAQEWKELDEEEKDIFAAGSDYLQALFQREQSSVLNKERPFNLNWQDAGMEYMNAALQKGYRPQPVVNNQNQVNAQVEEDMEVDDDDDYNDEFERVDDDDDDE